MQLQLSIKSESLCNAIRVLTDWLRICVKNEEKLLGSVYEDSRFRLQAESTTHLLNKKEIFPWVAPLTTHITPSKHSCKHVIPPGANGSITVRRQLIPARLLLRPASANVKSILAPCVLFLGNLCWRWNRGRVEVFRRNSIVF